MIIVGDYSGKYGRKINREFGDEEKIIFAGSIYHEESLDNLRHFSKALIHGHSVGGTNPSLLEAMSAGAWTIAHDNHFNRFILEDDALYFESSNDLTGLLKQINKHLPVAQEMISNNREKIRTDYQWVDIIQKYEDLFVDLLNN
jgi:glycosyltransferase involved in cell wall biosynthesis